MWRIVLSYDIKGFGNYCFYWKVGMEENQLNKLKTWFDEYVAGFYGEDRYVNANLKLKQDHTRRTCDEMLWLASQLGLDARQQRTAEVIALLHDISRFEQFVRYRTYNDTRSVNHCRMGLQIIHKTGMLEPLEQEERRIIETAIEYHGALELPGNLDGQALLFAKLIRDADKIDVLYVITDYYEKYTENPKDFQLELEFPDIPGYSPEVLNDVLNGRRTDYGKLRTLNDMNLLLLGWVYDVNFTATLRRIKQRGLLEKLVGFLPDTEDIRKAYEHVLAYIENRIAEVD
jgi:hypothetical protein